MRCVHQVQLEASSCFITLTLDDEHLVNPYFTGAHRADGRKVFGGTLQKKQFQDFAKRLRKYFGGVPISYYMCGEYGARYWRPHYHALLFGVRFTDLRAFKKSANGSVVSTSATLARLWPLGFSTVGEANFETAAYVARYVMKKISGPPAKEHYRKVCQDTGEIFDLLPEYNNMSLKVPYIDASGAPARGGIAAGWFQRFQTDVYPSDQVILRGREMRPPKYYDRIYELNATPRQWKKLKEAREAQAKKTRSNGTPKRLHVREEIKNQQVKLLIRELE